MEKQQRTREAIRSAPIPIAIFIVMAWVTVLVWHLQVEHRRDVVERHTQDIGAQAAVRLQIFVESHLRSAHIFTRGWSTDETGDFSYRRFERLASALLAELPGYHAVGLLRADSSTGYSVPADSAIVSIARRPEHRAVLGAAIEENTATLSPPFVDDRGAESVFAALPLEDRGVLVGHVLVEFHTETLIRDCFHSRIRSEFHFRVLDGDQELFRSAPEVDTELLETHPPRTNISFPVRNRSWELSMVPHTKQGEVLARRSELAVPILGLSLSFALSFAVFQLLRRMRWVRRARDEALREVSERQRTEKALRVSQARYQGVFCEATDGLVLATEDATILEVNPAAAKMLGEPADALVSKPITGYLATEHRASFDDFRRDVVDQKSTSPVEVELGGSGKRLNVEVHGSQITQEGLSRILFVLTDVTSSREALKRLASLSRKVIMAQEEERARLSRELHDELGQILTALQLEMGVMGNHLEAYPVLADLVITTASLAENATEQLRRICQGLRPPLLDDLGLGAAAEQLIREVTEHSEMQVHLDLRLDENQHPLTAERALCGYRILQEALNNVVRHSNASSVWIKLEAEKDELRVEVRDNGAGFFPGTIPDSGGVGLQGMHERASLVGGSVSIESFPGQGCLVEFVAGAIEETGDRNR